MSGTLGILSQPNYVLTVNQQQLGNSGHNIAQPAGQSFKTSQTLQLGSITVFHSTAGSGNTTIAIYTGQSVAIGNRIFIQTQPSQAGTGAKEYTLTNAPILTAETTYTFYVTDTSSGLIRYLENRSNNAYTRGQEVYSGTFYANDDMYFVIKLVTPV